MVDKKKALPGNQRLVSILCTCIHVYFHQCVDVYNYTVCGQKIFLLLSMYSLTVCKTKL